MRRSAAIVVGGLIVVAPVGCSSSESRDDAAPNPAGIVVEGQTRTVDGTTVCMDGPTGEVSIELDPPGTSLLAINLPDVALSAGRYRTSGVPTATRAGNTYTVKGQATVVGTPPERPVYKSFELEITCP
jgi:Mycobacterium 19 kDa lipoprotein antigen